MSSVSSFFALWKGAFVPYIKWFPELRRPGVLRADVIAGVTVALVLVPQSIAYASLAGLPPLYGLYASFIPVMVAGLFGSSRQLATGPVAVVSLLTASTLQPLATASPEGYLVYAMLLALLVGLFQLALGLFRMGALVDFLSHPVVGGFTNAAAIIIGTSQLSKLFGVSVPSAEHHYETVWLLLLEITQGVHLPTLSMALLAVALLLLTKRFLPRWPNVLIAVVATTVISKMLGFEAMGGQVVGMIPVGLPPFSIPTLELSAVVHLFAGAITIALIGFVEAISIAKAIAAKRRDRLDPNQELVGQGLANISAAFFNGYPVSGSFSRSALNHSSGAITGFSSVVTGLVVAITLLFLTPLFHHLPQATLGAVIIVVVMNLINPKPLLHAWKVEKHDGVVALVTFVLTLVFAPHLENGIVAGIILSLGLFVYRTMRPRFVEVSMHEDGTLRDIELFALPVSEHVSVLRLDMSLYFANAGYIETSTLNIVADRPELKFLIFDLRGVNSIDSTGEETLSGLLQQLSRLEIQLLLAGAKEQVSAKLEEGGFLDQLGYEHMFREVSAAIYYATARLDDPESTRCLRFPARSNAPAQGVSDQTGGAL